jgi:hypothetical protein
MTYQTKRAICAFSIAPLAAPLAFWAATFLSRPQANMNPLPFLIFGALYTYPIMLILGLPSYWIINAFCGLRARHVLGISAVVGAVILSLMEPRFTEASLAGGAALGLSSGITFWLIWRPARA